MIFVYMALGFACGALWAMVFKYLPPKWFCDYGESPSEKHERQCRQLSAKYILLFGVICAAIQGAFTYASGEGSWVSNCSVALLVPVLLLIALSDIKYTIIPNELLIIAAVLCAPYAFRNGYMQPLFGALIGGGVLFAIFFIASRLLKKEAMGFGDVLLSGLCGFMCGAKGYIIVLFIAVFSAAIVFSILLIAKKADKDTPQPFGPFLITGIILTICFWPFWQNLLQSFYGF